MGVEFVGLDSIDVLANFYRVSILLKWRHDHNLSSIG